MQNYKLSPLSVKDEQRIISLINDTDEGINLQMRNGENPLTIPLRQYMTNMLLIVRQSTEKNSHSVVLDGFINAIAETQAQIRRFEWKREERFIDAQNKALSNLSLMNDLGIDTEGYVEESTEAALGEVNRKIEPYNLLLNFWIFFQKIYTESLLAAPATAERQSKKPAAQPFDNFTDKLRNGFTEEKLNSLLVHMRMKDREGVTLKFEKYLLHPLIDALINEDYFIKGNRVNDLNSLAKFLGLAEGRVKSGYGIGESEARQKATAYLKEEHKKNCSNLVP